MQYFVTSEIKIEITKSVIKMKTGKQNVDFNSLKVTQDIALCIVLKITSCTSSLS